MSLDRLGLQRTSTLDFPGRVAAVVFTMGCPLRCPYCHNPELLGGPAPSSFLSREDVMAFLRRRHTILQGVVITGGEPFIHIDLPHLIREIAALGYTIKLDTTGLYPDLLRTVLTIPAVGYVAMDLKTLPVYYDKVAVADSTVTAETLLRSMAILREWRDAGSETGDDHQLEFRTTCAPGVVNPEDLRTIPSLLAEGDRWVLNQFRSGNCLNSSWNTVDPYEVGTLLHAAGQAHAKGIDAELRGV